MLRVNFFRPNKVSFKLIILAFPNKILILIILKLFQIHILHLILILNFSVIKFYEKMSFQQIFISIFFYYSKNNQHYIAPINIISIFLFVFLQNTQKILPKNTNDHLKNIISIFV